MTEELTTRLEEMSPQTLNKCLQMLYLLARKHDVNWLILGSNK